MKKKLGLKILGLVVFSLLLAVNCAEDGTAPDENLPPNTLITNYQIAIGPDSADAYSTTVYWSGSDADGAVFWYDWSIINASGDSLWWYTANDDSTVDTVNISTWQATNTLSLNLLLSFPDFDTRYVFRVRAQDNDREFDPTPAIDTIAIERVRDFNYAPNTEAVEGPGPGDLTTTGVHFVVQGLDIDGVVSTIAYKLDTDADWTVDTTDITTGALTVDVTDISLGSHTILFKAIDNFLKEDPSPLSYSFVVDSTLRPDITVVSGPVPNAYYYLPSGGDVLNLTGIWAGSAAWYYSTVEFRFAVDDSTDWTEWSPSTTGTLPNLTDTTHVFYLQVRDLAGNISSYTTNFTVGPYYGDNGIVVVNGIDAGTYGDEFVEFWNGVGGFGHEIDFWDAFSEDLSATPVLDTTFIGSGIMPGTILAHYSSMVMIMNTYNGDQAVYDAMLPLIMSYLNAGGNVFLGTRYAQSFIYGDLEDYCHIDHDTDWDPDLLGVNLGSGITAAVEGLVDIPNIGSLAGTDMTLILTDPEVTTLFTSASFPNAAAGFYVNPANTGKFAFIAGRPYRYDQEAYGANVEYILTNYFGEE
jgi:hypothetical protein